MQKNITVSKQKAIKNFPFQVYRVHNEFIMALTMIKKPPPWQILKPEILGAVLKTLLLKPRTKF